MKILLAGATGLIGYEFLSQIMNISDFENITILTRRKLNEFSGNSKLKQVIIDFDKLDNFGEEIKGDYLVCTMGTTIKKAGTKENFYKVDHDYCLKMAQLAQKNGTKHLILITAMGADANSSIFYNKVKGELEEDVKQIPFESIHIIRPSLLLGERKEKRVVEAIAMKVSKVIAFLFPIKYKPIDIKVIVKKIIALIKKTPKGLFIYEGKSIYEN